MASIIANIPVPSTFVVQRSSYFSLLLENIALYEVRYEESAISRRMPASPLL